MKIDIEYVAHLARLTLTSQEKEKFGRQLSKILEYMNKLNEIDTSKVKPTWQVQKSRTPLREDKVKSDGLSEQILSNAPTKESNPSGPGTYFQVKKIIE